MMSIDSYMFTCVLVDSLTMVLRCQNMVGADTYHELYVMTRILLYLFSTYVG